MHQHGHGPQPEKALPHGVRRVVAVGAGKGGVGKSTVSVNLAAALAAAGRKVGLLDADVYGPNLPQMLGVQNYVPKLGDDNKVEPAQAHGVKLMSMGFLLRDDAPVIWRGPLLHGAIQQLLRDVRWGELDVLLVDLPPGTGDVQLSIAQTVPLSGAVIVTTPQSVALSDVLKAAAMFRKLEVPILGVIENMGEFVCPHCRTSSRVFSKGAAQRLAQKHAAPLLGDIPLDPAVCAAGEDGLPLVLGQPESLPAQALAEAARKLAARWEAPISRQ
ncbi:MAG: Mrp/NBP35 family ATP-binding protein [Elusimicrobia bacterium]|nr:Mrp/NBP35 family ATP-binding protein [Elusimicrobiota bacterium]